MSLGSIGDGDVHNGGGGSFANVLCTTGLILPYLDIVFVGMHSLLRVRMFYYACGYGFGLMLCKKIVLMF